MFSKQKSQVLEAMSDSYFGIYVIDLKRDTYTEIKSQDLFRRIIMDTKSAQAGLNILCKRMVASEYQEDTNSFLDLSTLPERLKDRKIVSFEYYGAASGWSRANFYPFERDEHGDLITVIFSAEKQHELKAQQMHVQEMMEKTLAEKESAYELLKQKALESTIYLDALHRNATFLYCVDLTNGYLTTEIGMPGVSSALKKLGLTLPVSYDEFRKAYYEKMKIRTLESAENNVFRKDLLKAFEQGKTSVSTEYYSELYGKYHRNMIYMTRRDSDDHIIAVVIGSDITQQREAEERTKEELRKAYAQAQSASAAKTDFLSRMSHDIRTPINGIVGMMHIMKAEMDNRAKIEESIEKVEKLSNQLEMLINDILEMSRIERGEIRLAREVFDLQGLLENSEPALQVMADERGVVLAGAYLDVQHRNVIGSPLHMQRVAMNIMSNAIKYNRTGGSVKSWAREKPIDDAHSMYEFIVEDTGIGMSEEFQEHIFEPFVREEENSRASCSGTGLGMAITKELVDLMNGKISIRSQPGEGTTVLLEIPFEISVNPAEIEKDDVSVSLEGKHVLLVEDNKMNLEVAKYILEEEKATVDIARNGKEAVESFRQSEVGEYDLILMDIRMPVMDGYAATRAIRSMSRADAQSVPVVAMTANAFDEDVKNSREAGMNEHIAKPIDIDLMRTKISKLL